MRILFVSREYPPETGGGGIGSYVEEIGRALAGRGHQIHVLSCSEGQADEDSKIDGVLLHRRGVPRLLPKVRRRMPATAVRIEGAVACYVEARRLPRPDVVEAPDWRAEGLIFALRATRPLVIHLHTPLLLVGRHDQGSFHWTRDRRVAARVERAAVGRADLVTSPSSMLAGDLAREGWLGDRPTRIVRYPLNLDDWGAAGSAEQTPARILVVGRLEGRKAPEVVIRAAALLTPEVPDLEVVLVGSSSLRNGGSYQAWLDELARGLGVTCRFIDQIDRDRLRAWYGSSRVVVLPSRYDNFPFVGLEAMAAGRPLVCSRATGTSEILAGTDAGAVVGVDDHEAVSEAVRPYLLDAAEAARAGSAATELVARTCSPDRIASEREACYEEAIARWEDRRRRGRLRGRGS